MIIEKPHIVKTISLYMVPLGLCLFSVPICLLAADNGAISQNNFCGSLLPVIVGGLIGIFGSAVGGYLLFKLKSGHEISIFKKSKLEELSLLAYECDDWLDSLKMKYLIKGDIESIISKFPISRMKMIQALYFPTLESEVLRLASAVEDFRGLIILERPRLRKEQKYSDEFKSQYEVKQQAVLLAIQGLVKQVENLVPKKFKS
jgi:hypothetical protein